MTSVLNTDGTSDHFGVVNVIDICVPSVILFIKN